MIDLGCGSGAMCKIANGLGVTAFGIDSDPKVLEIPSQGFSLYHGDILTEGLAVRFQAELVLCLEVAEHVSADKADRLIERVASFVGGTLLFSAAIPGQGGFGHVNEQSHGYWREKLAMSGLQEHKDKTSDLRRIWKIVAPSVWWYGQNVMVWGVA
jgi:2-polyprenyl-3-methyl-5-hydroxy-6-metoxy-1,4-benzoquinol methylase